MPDPVDPDLLVTLCADSTEKRYGEIVSIFQENGAVLSNAEKLSLIDHLLVNSEEYASRTLIGKYEKIAAHAAERNLTFGDSRKVLAAKGLSIPQDPSRLSKLAQSVGDETFVHLAREKAAAMAGGEAPEIHLEKFSSVAWKALASLNQRQLAEIRGAEYSNHPTFDEFCAIADKIHGDRAFLFDALVKNHRFGHAIDLYQDGIEKIPVTSSPLHRTSWEEIYEKPGPRLVVAVGAHLSGKFYKTSDFRTHLNPNKIDYDLLMSEDLSVPEQRRRTGPVKPKDIYDEATKLFGEGQKPVFWLTGHGSLSGKTLEHYSYMDGTPVKTSDMLKAITDKTDRPVDAYLGMCSSAAAKFDFNLKNVKPGSTFVLATSFNGFPDQAYAFQVDDQNFLTETGRRPDAPQTAQWMMQTYMLGLKNQVPPQLVRVNHDGSMSVFEPAYALRDMLKTKPQGDIKIRREDDEKTEIREDILKNSKFSQKEYDDLYKVFVKEMKVTSTKFNRAISDINKASRPGEMIDWRPGSREEFDKEYGLALLISAARTNGTRYEDSRYPIVNFTETRRYDAKFLEEHTADNKLLRETEFMRTFYPQSYGVDMRLPLEQQFEEMIKMKGIGGYNAYHLFTTYFHQDALDRIGRSDACPDVNGMAGRYGLTPLHLMIMNKDITIEDIDRFIDDHKPDTDLGAKGGIYLNFHMFEGFGPAHFAFYAKRLDILNYLHEKEIDVFQENAAGLNPLEEYLFSLFEGENPLAQFLAELHRMPPEQEFEFVKFYIDNMIEKGTDFTSEDHKLLQEYIKKQAPEETGRYLIEKLKAGGIKITEDIKNLYLFEDLQKELDREARRKDAKENKGDLNGKTGYVPSSPEQESILLPLHIVSAGPSGNV
ncbi:MAG: hypothetical protein K9G62_08680 [Alphaproteobacteria bacterium]|nr:hypothetical protein [Alphaproteobacteria bacterium]